MKTWTGGAASFASWDNAANWLPQGVPGANDDVTFNAPADANIFSGEIQVRSVTLAAIGAALTVNSGARLSVPGGVTLAGGSLIVNGTLSSTTVDLQGGGVSGFGTFDTVTFTGTVDLDAQYRSMTIAGLTTLTAPAGQPGLRLTGPTSGLLNKYASATLDGGIVLFGSGSKTEAAEIGQVYNAALTLGASLTVDVVGLALLGGASGQFSALQPPQPVTGAGPLTNAGTINVGPGGTLQVQGAIFSTGAIHVASGTLDLTGAPTLNLSTPSLSFAGPVQMDDGAGKIILGKGQTVALKGFRVGDTLDIKGLAYSGATAQLSGDQLQVVQGGQVLAKVTLAGPTSPGATYRAAADGSGGTLVTTTAQPVAAVAFADQTTGASGSHVLDASSIAGPGYLQWQYLDSGSDTLAMTAALPNVFLKGGGGTKALAATSGQNVLDGGTGSAFLTGGSGTDTFFVDVRGGRAVWDTLSNFRAGDAVTVWGWVPGSGTETLDALAGAPGQQGATLRLAGGAGGPVSSVTFAGLSADQITHLQTATGIVSGQPYLYVYNPGV